MSHQRKLKRQTARRMALMASQVSGCVCRPDIVLHGIRAEVKHDSWCPMADHASHLIAYMEPKCGDAR